MAKRSIRHEYGRYITQLGKDFPELVVLEADLKDSTQSVQFQQAFPDRFIDVGIAEQNMVGIAAGLAIEGKIPCVHSFACFISMRACEFVRTSVAYPNLNVKFIVSHSGISAGTAGTTHHTVEDIAIMRAIPNMIVIAPGDVREMQQAVKAALTYKGPVYVRLGAYDVEDVYGPDTKFRIGKATILRKGTDVTIITTGVMAAEGVRAADQLLAQHRIRARVLQMASIKPLDRKAVIAAAKETSRIITVEEHNIIGGLGSAVAEVMATIGKGKLTMLGIQDEFAEVGSAAWITERIGLTAKKIIQEVLK